MSVVTDETNRSYREVVRDRRVAGLLLGDLLGSAGTGMIIVAMPVQTLAIHGSVPKAIAIGLVEAAPFTLSTILALAIGLGRVRVPPRTLLVIDCVLRSLTFTVLGILAVTHRLTLPVLILGLLFGATFRMAGSSSRRLLATSLAGTPGQFAVNGLLGLNATFALYIVGPVLGGVIVATAGAGVALFFDACAALILLAAVLIFVPPVGDGDALRRPRGAGESGWRILRRRPVAARLLFVEFFFNFFYMPIEVALPLYVNANLHTGASGLGLMWGALGIGAFMGAALVNQLRHLPQRHVLIAIIGLWAMCPIALTLVDSLAMALIVFGLGGLVWAPFTPVAYSFLQAGLSARRAAASRHPVDDRLHGGRSPRPCHRRTTHRTGRHHRRSRPVRRADPAAAPHRRHGRPAALTVFPCCPLGTQEDRRWNHAEGMEQQTRTAI